MFCLFLITLFIYTTETTGGFNYKVWGTIISNTRLDEKVLALVYTNRESRTEARTRRVPDTFWKHFLPDTNVRCHLDGLCTSGL